MEKWDWCKWWHAYSVQISVVATVAVCGILWATYNAIMAGVGQAPAHHLTWGQAALLAVPVPVVIAVFAALLLLGIYITSRLQNRRAADTTPDPPQSVPLGPIPSDAITASDHDGEKWRELVLVLGNYKALSKLIGELDNLAIKHSETPIPDPVVDGRGYNLRLQMATYDFEPLKREIVKCLAKIKNDQGIGRREVDEWLGGDLVGPGTMRNLMKALVKVGVDVRSLIPDRALELYGQR